MEKTSNKPLISVRALSKSFGELEVLKGVSTDIMPGEKVVVVGASGSGKSTFLRCLNCLEDPTGGEVIFEDVDIADPKVDINVHRQKMGMVFQQFNLFNNKSVLENIMLAPVMIRKKKLFREKVRHFSQKEAVSRKGASLFRKGRCPHGDEAANSGRGKGEGDEAACPHRA